jgi:hypothetical protein
LAIPVRTSWSQHDYERNEKRGTQHARHFDQSLRLTADVAVAGLPQVRRGGSRHCDRSVGRQTFGCGHAGEA